MIRRFPIIIILMSLALGVGFMPYHAHGDIFLRKNTSKQEDSNVVAKEEKPKRGVFLRRALKATPKKRANPQRVQNYGSRLSLQNAARELNRDLKALSYWQNSGRSPKTEEEILSYADAHRAQNRAIMLKRRAEKEMQIAAIEQKRESDFLAQNVAQSKNTEATLLKPLQKATTQSVTRRVSKTAQPSKRPSRVFRDYR